MRNRNTILLPTSIIGILYYIIILNVLRDIVEWVFRVCHMSVISDPKQQ